MKTFEIPGLDIDFIQHKYAQPVSTDTYLLYKAVVDSHADEKPQDTKKYHILDIGCGSGILLLMLAKDWHKDANQYNLTGIEIQKKLVEMAEENTQKDRKSVV